MQFFVWLFVSMIDPINLIGWVLSGWFCRPIHWALLAASGWSLVSVGITLAARPSAMGAHADEGLLILTRIVAGLLVVGLVYWVANRRRKMRRPDQDPDEAKRAEIAKTYIKAAKKLKAKTPREAAEIATGRALTDDEWDAIRQHWERHW